MENVNMAYHEVDGILYPDLDMPRNLQFTVPIQSLSGEDAGGRRGSELHDEHVDRELHEEAQTEGYVFNVSMFDAYTKKLLLHALSPLRDYFVHMCEVPALQFRYMYKYDNRNKIIVDMYHIL